MRRGRTTKIFFYLYILSGNTNILRTAGVLLSIRDENEAGNQNAAYSEYWSNQWYQIRKTGTKYPELVRMLHPITSLLDCSVPGISV